MSKESKQQFEIIAKDVDFKTAAVRCTPQEYRHGLDVIIGRLQEAKQASIDIETRARRIWTGIE